MEKIEDGKDGVQTTAEPVKAEPEKPIENTDIAKLKAALSKANSEAAEFKRQLREKQSEAERAEAERQEREKQREARIAELEAKERIHNYKTKLMEAGIDAVAADLMAKALPDGVADEYFTATKAVLADAKQKAVNDSLSKQPGLSVGTPPSGKTAAELEMEQLRKNIGL